MLHVCIWVSPQGPASVLTGLVAIDGLVPRPSTPAFTGLSLMAWQQTGRIMGATLPYAPPPGLELPWLAEGGGGDGDEPVHAASDVAQRPALARGHRDMNAAPLTTHTDRPGTVEPDSRPGLGEETFFGRGEIRQEPCCQPFKLLFAAFDGCRECCCSGHGCGCGCCRCCGSGCGCCCCGCCCPVRQQPVACREGYLARNGLVP